MRKTYALTTYPLNRTFIGNFSEDPVFYLKNRENVNDIDQWEYDPFDWGNGAVPFVLYKDKKFESLAYCYSPLVGYFTKKDTDDYQLVFPYINDDEHSFEMMDFDEINNTQSIILKSKEDTYESLVNAVEDYVRKHFTFDAVFFTYDDIKNFCYNNL